MTSAQTKLYFRRWGNVRRSLRARGFSAQEADAERKEIHKRAGAPASSKRFSNRHLDAVLEEFDAELEPDRIPDRILTGAKRRLVYSIHALLNNSGLEHPQLYADKIISGKFSGRTLADISQLDEKQLRQLLMTLRNRLVSRSGHEA